MRKLRKAPKNNARAVRHIDGNVVTLTRNELGDPLQLESFQERKLSLKLLRDKNCHVHISQPADPKLWYINPKGQKISYTADILAKYFTAPDIVFEVTLSSRMEEKPHLILLSKSVAPGF